MATDWKKEKENLKVFEEKNWWKPTSGVHKIKLLTEPEEFSFVWSDKGEEKTITKEAMKIEIEGKKFDWAVSKGISQNSLWGQLVLLGSNWNGIKGKEITLIIKGSGKEISYIVQEALPLMVKTEKV